MSLVNWHATKNSLLADPKLTKNLILSKDVHVNSGIKQFATFNNFKKYIAYLDNNKNTHLYEIIFNNTDFPVYMYFDLDQDLNLDTDHDIIQNYDKYCSKLVIKFLKSLKKFIEDLHSIKLHDNFDIGNNVQICKTSLNKSKPKLSLHIKINIIMNSVHDMQTFANNYSNYLLSNKYNTSQTVNIFNYKKNSDVFESIIDKSVYSNFRSFRLVYSSKITTKLPKIPAFNSSSNINDHLINIHDENPQNIINIKINPIVINIEGNYNQISMKTVSKKKIYNIEKSVDEKNYSCMPQKTIDDIKSLLTNNHHINALFNNIKLEFDEISILRENVCSFVITKSINHVCPYAKRTHSHNRSYFIYNKNKNLVYYGCFNEDCKKKKI